MRSSDQIGDATLPVLSARHVVHDTHSGAQPAVAAIFVQGALIIAE